MPDKSNDGQLAEERKELPEVALPVPDGPNWQERYVEQNADTIGQSGGQPVAPRGPGHSTGGFVPPQEEGEQQKKKKG